MLAQHLRRILQRSAVFTLAADRLFTCRGDQ